MAKRKKTRSGEAFVLRDGRTVETRAQLVKELKSMSDDDFRFFCNDEKNDFHTWIRDCLDEDLAGAIRDVRDRQAMITALKI